MHRSFCLNVQIFTPTIQKKKCSSTEPVRSWTRSCQLKIRFRPSGTEDVVRVYAESDTQVRRSIRDNLMQLQILNVANCETSMVLQEHADALAYEVAGKVHELAGGVGDLPSRPV